VAAYCLAALVRQEQCEAEAGSAISILIFLCVAIVAAVFIWGFEPDEVRQ